MGSKYRPVPAHCADLPPLTAGLTVDIANLRGIAGPSRFGEEEETTMVEQLAPYSGSIIGLMVTGIIILLLGPAVAARKAGATIKPGSEPENDYDDATYRLHRSHMNAVENYAQFAIPTLIAMLVGASVTWVAILVWATVIARLLYTFVYLQNIGKPAQGMRSFVFVAAWLLNIAMVILVIVAVL